MAALPLPAQCAAVSFQITQPTKWALGVGIFFNLACFFVLENPALSLV